MNLNRLYAMCDKYGVSVENGLQYHHRLLFHIELVQYACTITGVSDDRAHTHDASKFFESEFPQYARQFYEDEKNLEEFKIAWLHHQNHNDHHWNYWVLAESDKPIPMPEMAVREMVADWMAVGYEKTGEWNIDEWLHGELPKMKLHEATRHLLSGVLRKIGSSIDPREQIYYRELRASV